MKNFHLFILCFATFGMLFFTACESDAVVQPEENLKVDSQRTEVDPEGAELDFSDHPAHGHEDGICDHVLGQAFHDLDDVEVIDFELPTGEIEKRYLIEDDIALTKEEFKALKSMDAEMMKQYRTWNLVNNYQTIYVMGWTGSGYALTPKMRTALQWAINNYNALPIGLNFSLSFGTYSSNKDIVVYKTTNGQAGGIAGFPTSSGNPHKWVQIYDGTDSYSYNVVEHVMTHEIGHCLGLRHTDYATRASCGQNSNEGWAGVGAIHVPGTPWGIDWNSVMLACFNSGENGEFGYYDRVALQYLY